MNKIFEQAEHCMRESLRKELPGLKPEDLEKLGAGALRRAAIEGDVRNGSCMCGQIAGLVNSEGTCEEIITGICRDAYRLMGKE